MTVTKDKVEYTDGMTLFAAESEGVRPIQTVERIHGDYAKTEGYEVPMVNIGAHYASRDRAATEADIRQRIGDHD